MKNYFREVEMLLSAKNIAMLSKRELQGCRNVLQFPFLRDRKVQQMWCAFLEFSQKIIEYHLGMTEYDEFFRRMIFLDMRQPFVGQPFRFFNFYLDIEGKTSRYRNQALFNIYTAGIYEERELIQRNTATQKALEKLQARTEGVIQKTVKMLRADEERKGQRITNIEWALEKLETEMLQQKEGVEELKAMYRELQKLSRQVQNRRTKEVRYREILDNHMQLERMRYGIPD